MLNKDRKLQALPYDIDQDTLRPYNGMYPNAPDYEVIETETGKVLKVTTQDVFVVSENPNMDAGPKVEPVGRKEGQLLALLTLTDRIDGADHRFYIIQREDETLQSIVNTHPVLVALGDSDFTSIAFKHTKLYNLTGANYKADGIMGTLALDVPFGEIIPVDAKLVYYTQTGPVTHNFTP